MVVGSLNQFRVPSAFSLPVSPLHACVRSLFPFFSFSGGRWFCISQLPQDFTRPWWTTCPHGFNRVVQKPTSLASAWLSELHTIQIQMFNRWTISHRLIMFNPNVQSKLSGRVPSTDGALYFLPPIRWHGLHGSAQRCQRWWGLCQRSTHGSSFHCPCGQETRPCYLSHVLGSHKRS